MSFWLSYFALSWSNLETFRLRFSISFLSNLVSSGTKERFLVSISLINVSFRFGDVSTSWVTSLSFDISLSIERDKFLMFFSSSSIWLRVLWLSL